MAKKEIKLKKPEVRFLYDLKNVVFDKNFLSQSKNLALYYMWRSLREKNGLRYDITLIPPRMLGKEFVKTKGHYHIGNFGELYKVLAGEGIFLMQKIKKNKIEDVYYVKAKRGEYVVVPKGYGHTTINPSKKILKMANWISKKCLSDYKSIERKKGFCYYLLKEGWIKNPNYQNIPPLKRKMALKKMPKNINFLF